MSNISLDENEKVGWKGGVSSKVLYSSVISAIILAIVLFIFVFVGAYLALQNLVLALLVYIAVTGVISTVFIFLPTWFKVKNTTYAITNKRIIHDYNGKFSSKNSSIEIDKIQNTEWSQGALQGMFNLGSVDVSSASSGNITFKHVKNPEKVKSTVSKSINKFGKKSDKKSSGKGEGKIEKKILHELKRLNKNLEKKGDK